MFTGLLYGAMVFASEITVGNPHFPIHFWEFTRISAWKWSFPVHLGGFIWLVFWNEVLKKRPVIWPVIASISFFAAAEALNHQVFNFFIYAERPFGADISFLLIIGLYACLCLICSILLRIDGFAKRQYD
jgi:hypothetical protein